MLSSPHIVKKSFILLFFFLFLSGFQLSSQDKLTAEQYIDRFKKTAIEKMKEYKIPASITLAQGILESGNGNSKLAVNANNHFGIKCHKGWEGGTFYMDDDEQNECFRKYKNPEQSYHDHSLFLTQRSRYAFLFELDIMDYKAWAHGLSKAGYATNPRYPELLIRIIERHNLHQYDLEARDKKKDKKDKINASDTINHAFIAVNPSDFSVVGKSAKGRYIHENNNRKLIFAREGDQISSLAAEFNIYSWQIVKYNEFDKHEKLAQNQIVYLEKKRRKSHSHEMHILREGESMHAVSQLYGIRLKHLYRINKIPEGEQAAAGSTILLR